MISEKAPALRFNNVPKPNPAIFRGVQLYATLLMVTEM